MKNIKDLKKFRAVRPNVIEDIQNLVVRGCIIVDDQEDFVVLERGEQIATVDKLGRIDWRRNTSK